MLELKNSIRDYAWGSKTMIPELLGEEPSGNPEAEVWIGAHPDSPSMVGNKGLDQILSQNPKLLQGSELHLEQLPYLMKILAADTALSLQVHPSKEQAETGFETEENTGIEKTAPQRNYKDDNHKPEMIFAISDFEALNGFRHLAEIQEIFNELGHYHKLAALPLYQEFQQALKSQNGLQDAFTLLVSKPAGLEQLVTAVTQAANNAKSSKYSKEFATLQELEQLYPGDAGVVLSLMLNRVSLKPGQAMYTGAGNVHAYLHGLGIEVMASSDNVLRGGLTPKHMDVPELLKIVDFEPLDVPVLKASENDLGQDILQPPFDEFQLQVIELEKGQSATVAQNGPTIVLLTQGALDIETPQETKSLLPSASVFVAHDESPVSVKAIEKSQAFAVTVNQGTSKS
ncbi:MAG: mannose-6-phosphate isomerase, class I [Micrococcaceae bacterium]